MERYKSLAQLRAEKAHKEAVSIDEMVNRYTYTKRKANNPENVKQDVLKQIKKVCAANGLTVADGDLPATFAAMFPQGLPDQEPTADTIKSRLPLLVTISDTHPLDQPAITHGANLQNETFKTWLGEAAEKWTDKTFIERQAYWDKYKQDQVAKARDPRAEFLLQMRSKYQGDLTLLTPTERMALAELSDDRPKSSGYHAPTGLPTSPEKTEEVA